MVLKTKTKTGAKPSALERLRELEQTIAAAQRAEREAEGRLRQLPRRRDAAQGQLRQYFAGVGAGDPPDPDRERELRDELTALENRLVQEHVWRNGQRLLEWVDPEAEGRAEGAREATQLAHSAVAQFTVEHRDELQAELTQEAIAARDRLLEAIDGLSTAAGKWSATARRWRDLGAHWGIAPAEIPANPLPGIAQQDIELVAMQVRGGARDPRGALPMPVRLAPGSSGELEHAGDLSGWQYVPRVVSSAGGLIGA